MPVRAMKVPESAERFAGEVLVTEVKLGVVIAKTCGAIDNVRSTRIESAKVLLLDISNFVTERRSFWTLYLTSFIVLHNT